MNRILIANRGEIAIRIQKTLEKMGIESVAIFHSDEKGCMHERNATFSVDLGKGSLQETYLNITKIIAVAKDYSCDAVHPGYGFLSENPDFAAACEKNNIKYIGPRSEVIRQMGNKSRSKDIALRVGIPVLKSVKYELGLNPEEVGLEYPLLIKAVAGGGGKGMKVVHQKKDLSFMAETAKREAKQYFGNDELFVEPYLENARHIEVQVLGDGHGKIMHLFERECSLQRNHQKIIEEAPATSISDELRTKLHNAAIKYSKELAYRNAGTVEFLVSGDKFFLLEMNTRIQVEHPVTEMITGIDLVEEQIKIAQGLPLTAKLKNAGILGHAMEARVYAENPYQSYMPSTGDISLAKFPLNVRVDTFIESGTQVTPHFDSMLAKIIVHGKTRQEAIEKLNRAIGETHIHGVRTNLTYLKQITEDKDFCANEISTMFLHQKLENHSGRNTALRRSVNKEILILAFVYNNFIRKSTNPANLWERSGPGSFLKHFKVFVDGTGAMVKLFKDFYVEIDGKGLEFWVIEGGVSSVVVKTSGQDYSITYSRNICKPYDSYEINGQVFKLATPLILRMSGDFLANGKLKKEKTSNQIISPLFGKVIDVLVKENDKVKKGDVLLTIESMKTENQILAPGEGIIQSVLVKKGLQVEENKELITLNCGI